MTEFEKSIAEHQSYFWDQEGLDQSNSNECPRLNITAVSEGEDQDILHYLENIGRLNQSEQPPTERESRKSTVRFMEAPEFMDSPILGQQSSRRSLFQTPTMAPVPFPRSTRTQLGTEQPNVLIGDEEKPEKDFSPFQSKKDFPLIRSTIDIRLPPLDLTPPLLEEEVMKMPQYHSSLQKALEIAPSIRHEWTEPISYRRDNYAHFISEDCEPSNAIFKLLIAKDRVDPQELWEKRPRKGRILVTALGK